MSKSIEQVTDEVIRLFDGLKDLWGYSKELLLNSRAVSKVY